MRAWVRGSGWGGVSQRPECLRPQGAHRSQEAPSSLTRPSAQSELTGSRVQERRMVQDPRDKDRRAGG